MDPEQTYEGGCHCGRVRFRVRTRATEVLDCNCSMCAKKGFLHLIVTNDEFEVTSGQDAIREYRFNTGVARHMFCATCGVHSFYKPRSHPNGWDINARCLDGDALARFRVAPFDGKNWEASVDAIR
jgi:hypothetical protein